MRMRLRKISALPACALLACCAALLPCGCGRSDSESEVAALVSVEAQRPQMGPIAEHIDTDATLAPLAQAAIVPRIVAPVLKFYVQRGSKVKAGQLLAVLENRDLSAAALDSRGQYQAAQAAYAIQTQAQTPEDYQKAQLDLAQAKAQLDLSQSVVRARKELFAQGAIPGRDLDTAMAGLVQAQAAYDNAAQHMQAMQSVSRQALLRQARGQLTSAKGRYLDAEAQASYARIVSPIAGVVTDRPLFAGETAAAGSPLVTVMDTSSLLAKLHLAQSAAQRLTLGEPAQILVPGADQPVPATVSFIGPALDPGSGTVEIWLRLDNRGGGYKVGTPVRAIVTGEQAARAMKIPLSAILTAADGAKYVMAIGADDAARRKNVRLGIQDGKDAQVLSGLGLNDNVIVTGAYGLDEGTKVKVAAAGDNGDPAQ